MFIGDLLFERQYLTKAGHRKAMKVVTKSAGESHKKINLPRHFQPQAYRLYGYGARTVKHERQKRSRYGHNRPNVFTGRLMAAVLATASVTSTADRWTMRASGTQEHPITAVQRLELSRMSGGEHTQHNKEIKRQYRSLVQGGQYSKRKRIRVKN